MKSICHKHWAWIAWNVLVSFRVNSHTNIEIYTFDIVMKTRKLALPINIKCATGFLFVIKPGPLAKQPASIRFYGVGLSPSEVLLMISLQSTDSLLHNAPDSESFNSELAWSFPFAAEFWNNPTRALQVPLVHNCSIWWPQPSPLLECSKVNLNHTPSPPHYHHHHHLHYHHSQKQ